MPPTRRAVLAGLSVLAFLRPAWAAAPQMTVARDPDCGCCGAWVDLMREAGFDVSVRMMDPGALQDHRAASGVPAGLASCHTAHVDGYVIEGHVPAADIRRLLREAPDAIGLSVPGMPFGSPGMGDETQRDAYAVLLIRRDGTSEVYSSYDAA